MARGSRLVNELQIVEEVVQFNVAKDDRIYGVDEGYVVCEGVIRQFWPRDITAQSPIVMSVSDVTSYEIKNLTEGEPTPVCNLDVRTGKLIFSNPDGTTFTETVLAPPPRGTGVYLWKFDIISGPIVADDPTGSWVDVFSEGTLGIKSYRMPNTTRVPGQVLGQAQVTLALDDGGGSPEAGSEVVKTVYFIAEITGSNFVLSKEPWALEDYRINEAAYVSIVVGNDGVLRGYEHGIEILKETYAVTWGENFKVQLNPTGDTLKGDQVNKWLSTDVDRSWELSRIVDGLSQNVSTLFMTDGVRTITKQITLNAEYATESADSDISDEWTRYDKLEVLVQTYNGQTAQAAVVFWAYSDGTINAVSQTPGTNQMPDFPQDWNVNAPTVSDPENFEIRCTKVSGGIGTSEPAGILDVWRNLGDAGAGYLWVWGATATGTVENGGQIDYKLGTFLFEIREVGRPITVKSKTVDIDVAAVSAAPGGPQP